VCEELTFRGFILTGLQRRFRPRTAVLLSSFLFALLQMNVFRFVPAFLLGVVLAYLTTRCGSVLPAMLFRVIYDTLPLVPGLLYLSRTGTVDFGLAPDAHTILAAVCAVASAGLLWRLSKHRPHPAYVAFLQSDPGLEPALGGTAR
jgi:membrane protease YdiL (CAAX protease family)